MQWASSSATVGAIGEDWGIMAERADNKYPRGQHPNGKKNLKSVKGRRNRATKFFIGLFGEEAFENRPHRKSFSAKQMILRWAEQAGIISPRQFKKVLGWINKEKDPYAYIAFLKILFDLLPKEDINQSISKFIFLLSWRSGCDSMWYATGRRPEAGSCNTGRDTYPGRA